MPTLTKDEIIIGLIQNHGFNRKTASDFVEEFFKAIIAPLEAGEQVKLSGFGNFVLNDKTARPGRNPKTGEDFEIAARRVVTFKAGGALKRLIAAKREVDH